MPLLFGVDDSGAGPGDSRWPRFTTELRGWEPREDNFFPATRRLRRTSTGDYYAAVPAKIAEARPELPSEVIALADEASQAIVRSDSEFGEVSNVFASLMLRTESASSSQIENLTSTAKALAVSELGRKGRRNADMIGSNVHAMVTAIERADRIELESIQATHHELMKNQAPDTAGKWRNEAVWIGGSSYSPHDAEYVAPHHSWLAGALEDLLVFAQRVDIPALIQAVIVHAQFENIHPFSDRNGRTGRALLPAMLRTSGLSPNTSSNLVDGNLAKVYLLYCRPVPHSRIYGSSCLKRQRHPVHI